MNTEPTATAASNVATATSVVSPPAAVPARRRVRYEVLSPGQRQLLWAIFALVAVLGANSAYLASVTFLGWWYRAAGEKFEQWFYGWMFLFHIVLGLIFAVPLVTFAVTHWRTARHLPNRRAFRMGQALFATSLVVLISGLLLTFLVASSASVSRAITYWLHVISPLVAIWLYILHRLAGPPIRWRVGAGWAGAVVGALALMVVIHLQDPRKWNQVGPKEGLEYFFPSLARTTSGKFIAARTMMNDQYCKDCHPDIHARWEDSVHRISSFNNKAYLTSVRETRKMALERDHDVKASRFCAGCHDPVPFFSGAFDDPKFDDVNHPTAQAGITCTVCHSITAINSDRGNADFTIEEAIHYPFAFSENSALKYINHQLIKAKPSFHKKTFLKPLHTTANFCGACHKVHLPEELNHYKWLRGQNHYDSFLLSGASGVGARSFYYPEVAHENCNRCHMPPQPSNDVAAKMFAGAEKPSVHDHLFLGANTALAHWRGKEEVVQAHQEFLKDCLRVDLFGLRTGKNVTGPLTAPLRPKLPELKPSEDYIFEVVVRNLKVGHPFTQGTADSNEAWLDVTVRSGERVIARSGEIDPKGTVDPWSYFLNAYVLNRNGNRIDRRNAQDIFVPLYDHQIPPGSARVARFGLKVPPGQREPLTIEVKVSYRKFDQTYMEYVHGKDYRNDLPVTIIATDSLTLPAAGGDALPGGQAESPIPLWQRWNDYGIAQAPLSFLGVPEAKQVEGKEFDLRAALEAFTQVEKLGYPDGPLNQARAYLTRGDVSAAGDALRRATAFKDKPPPRWTLAWLWATVLQEQGQFEPAESQLRSILDVPDVEMHRRNLDFRRDYLVINKLGNVLFERSKVAASQLQGAKEADRESLRLKVEALRQEAVQAHQRTLALDPENLAAHYNLYLLYGLLGDAETAKEHQKLHLKYKPDENARDRAIAKHRSENPAANHAATPGAIHPLHAPGESPGPPSP